jgi:hypothetical protein
MALRKRMMVVERDSDSEESPDDDDAEEEEEKDVSEVEEEEEEEEDDEAEAEVEVEEVVPKSKKSRIIISLKGQKVCKVTYVATLSWKLVIYVIIARWVMPILS